MVKYYRVLWDVIQIRCLNYFSVFLLAVYSLARQRFGFLPDEIAPFWEDEEGGAEAIKEEKKEIEGEEGKKEKI